MNNLLAEIQIPNWVFDYPWILPAVIGVVGILGYGFKDVLRFSLSRAWAIGGVCFRDAIRRRVLWITPLAMLGVIVVTQLQKPVDEPDAVRQTIKFCFFATAIVVTVIALITAATNLPREIENRVVFTIVTKPVTRMEIVLGKIIGFARVSAAMLLIMGLFTTGYLHIRGWYLNRQITAKLQDTTLEISERGWLEHFQQQGLLTARTIRRPDSLLQFAKLPDEKSGHWIMGGAQDALLPFRLVPGNLGNAANPQAPATADKAYFFIKIPFEKIARAAAADPSNAPPAVRLQVWDKNLTRVVLTDVQLAAGDKPVDQLKDASKLLVPLDGFARLELTRNFASVLEQLGDFYVQVVGDSGDHLYNIEKDAVTLVVGHLDSRETAKIAGGAEAIGDPITRGSVRENGQELHASERGVEPVAVFRFTNATDSSEINGQVPFEFKVAIDKSGDSDTDDPTQLAIQVQDTKTKALSAPTLVYPENRRTTFFTLPAEAVRSGNFDVLVRCTAGARTISLNSGTLQLIANHEPFIWNLAKGLFILWLFSILVTMIAFLCSTFLSWPIAVVLSVMIVLGKWAVMNLDIGTGMGAQFAQEYFSSDTTAATVMNQTVEALTRILMLVTIALPDITPFGVTEQIERGATISLLQVGEPLMVLGLFGIPFLTFAYIFLRNKEVAP